jgi:hypothetical protein
LSGRSTSHCAEPERWIPARPRRAEPCRARPLDDQGTWLRPPPSACIRTPAARSASSAPSAASGPLTRSRSSWLASARELSSHNAYALSNEWANEQLHDTPLGLPFVLSRDGVRTRDRAKPRAVTAHGACWTFGQLVYSQFEYGGRDPELPRLRRNAFPIAIHSLAECRRARSRMRWDVLAPNGRRKPARTLTTAAPAPGIGRSD